MNRPLLVKEHTQYFTDLWSACIASLPGLEGNYPSREKKMREKYFENFIEIINKRNNQNGNNHSPHEKITPLTRALFKTVFDYKDAQLDVILSDAYKQMTKDFIRMGRRFDPDVSLDDVFQACRNAWIMNGIQLMLGQDVKLTPAIFAYSMLYPYSDNYLDDPGITVEGKVDFSRRFRNKLEGFEELPVNKNESLIFNLVEMIEEQFDRDRFPEVFNSLLAIHDAQAKSLRLVDPHETLSEKEVLDLSIEKGGTSVLADGYLVAGKMNESQARFCFGFGAYLQLVDDIQDIKEDSCAGQLTVFSKTLSKQKLDSLATQTFCFGNKVFDLMDAFPGENIPVYKSLMKKSVETMLIETILLSGQYFSHDYIKMTENHSPLSVSYLKKRRSKLSPQRISFMKQILESTIADL